MEKSTKDKQLQTSIAGGKLFNFRPVFFIAVFLAIGIAFAYFYLLYGVSLWWSVCLLPVVCVPFFYCRSAIRAKRILLAAFTLVIAFFIGFSLFTARVNALLDAGIYDGEYVAVGRVVGKEKTDKGWRLTLEDVYIDGKEEDGQIIAYVSEQSGQTVKLSDELVLKGDISTQSEFFNDYGFASEAVGGGVRYYMWTDDYVVTGHKIDIFLAVRERIQTVLYAGMDETPAAATVAVLTGDTSGMESGLLKNIRYGGVAHIFAVSGLHIGALFGACVGFIKKTKLRKTPKLVQFLLVAGVLLFYGGVCGYSPSVIRAITMCMVLYASKLIGIGSDALENVGASAVLVLLLSPTSLFEVGFQLSYAACIGIIVLAAPMQRAAYAIGGALFGKKLERNTDAPLTLTQSAVRSIVSFLSVTFAAQIFTAPILLYSFGYLSVWSLLLNCIFVPLIGVVFSALLLMAFVMCLLPVAIAKYVLFLPNVLLTAVLLFFEIFDFSLVAFSGWRLTWSAFACYYLAWSFATDKWNLSRELRALLFTVCAVGCVLTTVVVNI
ncbi:MAG: ComEC family competence protein [Clostridiales bacterium]|nr:ComEC family competence protein [Clostridiales bacterium]